MSYVEVVRLINEVNEIKEMMGDPTLEDEFKEEMNEKVHEINKKIGQEILPAMQENILNFYPKAAHTILKICFKRMDSDAVKLSLQTLGDDDKFSLVEMFLRQQLRDGCDGYGYFDVTKMYKILYKDRQLLIDNKLISPYSTHGKFILWYGYNLPEPGEPATMSNTQAPMQPGFQCQIPHHYNDHMDGLIAVAEKNGFGHSEAYSMVYDALAELRREEVQEEEEICGTCGLDYSNCPTCECPNDAKCLRLCEQMSGGKCPHYPYSDSDDEEEIEEDPDRCVRCDGKVEMDGDECMHCCNWNCDKMVCGKSGCSSQLAFFECCQECEAEAREQGEESDEEDPDLCVRCDRTFDQRKTIFNDGDCAKAWELHCDSGDDEGDLCATCLQKWVDEVKANGEWNRLAEL